MKKSVFSALITGLLWGMTLRAQLLPGSELKSYPAREVDVYLQGRLFQATGTFTKSGNSYDSLPSGYDFKNTQIDLGLRSQVMTRTALFGSLTTSSTEASLPGGSRSSAGLSEATIGTDFVLSNSELAILPEFLLTHSFAKINYASSDAATNEGATQATAKLIGLIRSSQLHFGAFTSFTYRTEGLASLFGYGLLSEYDFGHVQLGADLRGFSSLTYDTRTETEMNRDLYQCRANGCAKKFGAVNPMDLQANAWVKWNVAPEWQLHFGGGADLTGQSYAMGYQVQTGLLYRWDLGPTFASRAYGPTPRRRVMSPTFQEKIDDGVDQNLFVPPEPPVPDPAIRLRPSPDAERKRQRQQIQNDLNKTEMQIELRSNKKKRRR